MTAEKVILTGGILDGHIEVKMRYDMIRYARPCFAMPVLSIPTENWIAKYGPKFWGFVTFDQGKEEDLILIGIVPLDDNNFPAEGLIDRHYFYSEKFRIFMDDAGNTFTVDALADGNINLGSVTASHPAVLGDVLKQIVQDTLDALLTAKTNTNLGPQPFMPTTITKLNNIKGRLDTMLSTKIKLI